MGDAVEPVPDADGITTVATPITLDALASMAEAGFGNLVKAVVERRPRVRTRPELVIKG